MHVILNTASTEHGYKSENTYLTLQPSYSTLDVAMPDSLLVNKSPAPHGNDTFIFWRCQTIIFLRGETKSSHPFLPLSLSLSLSLFTVWLLGLGLFTTKDFMWLSFFSYYL
jgi:hypothetical protein